MSEDPSPQSEAELPQSESQSRPQIEEMENTTRISGGSGSRVRGYDHIARLNYLFQASEEIVKQNSPASNLAQNYGRIMATIAEKTSAKLDFTLKRSLCKNCKSVLVPGVNAVYRLRKKKSPKGSSKKRRGFPTQIITCKSRGACKKFNTDPKFHLKEEGSASSAANV